MGKHRSRESSILDLGRLLTLNTVFDSGRNPLGSGFLSVVVMSAKTAYIPGASCTEGGIGVG